MAKRLLWYLIHWGSKGLVPFFKEGSKRLCMTGMDLTALRCASSRRRSLPNSQAGDTSSSAFLGGAFKSGLSAAAIAGAC